MLNARLLRNACLAAVTAAILLMPGCTSSVQHEGNWFQVFTLVDVRIFDGFSTTIQTVDEPRNITGAWVSDNINASGTVKIFGPLVTDFSGQYTQENARLRAFWKFHANDGPCRGQDFKEGGTGSVNIDIQTGNTYYLWCTFAMQTPQTMTLGTNTISKSGDIVSLHCCDTDTLYGTTTLYPGDYIYSGDGRFVLSVTYDGGLALYERSNQNMLWSSEI